MASVVTPPFAIYFCKCDQYKCNLLIDARKTFLVIRPVYCIAGNFRGVNSDAVLFMSIIILFYFIAWHSGPTL